MGYQSKTIAKTIKLMNVRYFLPAIQREFVWKPVQIVQLFDSLMRGYPISSFLFWAVNDENKSKWEVYKFIENARQGGTHNELTNTNGVQELTLVLDGQQRLTSLMIALKGAYTVKKPYYRWDNPKAWVRQKLFVDLLKDPKTTEDDTEIGLRYRFAFMDNPQKVSISESWFEVGRILDFDSEDRFYDFKLGERNRLPDAVTKGQMMTFEMNLDRLYRAIWKDSVISFYTEFDQDYDRVLDIFVRANEGGTKLSKSDLLLSMVTAKWKDVNAREEIFGFVDRLNKDLIRKNNLDKDFIMKTCLVLCDLPVAYKVENFTNKNLTLIFEHWEEIKSAIERTINLINSFGIDRDTLTSANALIPIAYYFYQRPTLTLMGTSPIDVQNASRIRKWLLQMLLNTVFGTHSDSILRDTRATLKRLTRVVDFPDQMLNDEIVRSGRVPKFDDFAINDFLSIRYGRREVFLALSLLYEERNWGTMAYHQDHIFPRSDFNKRTLSSLGYSPEDQRKLHALRDRVGNLQLLLEGENLEKSNSPFDDWIKSRDQEYKKRHLVPDDPDLYKLVNFEKFLNAREDLILQKLQNIFSSSKLNSE